jgi:hypothetical protein
MCSTKTASLPPASDDMVITPYRISSAALTCLDADGTCGSGERSDLRHLEASPDGRWLGWGASEEYTAGLASCLQPSGPHGKGFQLLT